MRLSFVEVTLLMEIVSIRNKTIPKALISNNVAMAIVKPKVKMRSFSCADDSLGEYINNMRAMKKLVSKLGVKKCRNFPQLSNNRKIMPGI